MSWIYKFITIVNFDDRNTIVRMKSVKTNKTLEYFTGILRTKLLLNIIPYNQDKILRTDAITFKVKITQYMEELFFPQTNPLSLLYKTSQYIQSPFRVSISRHEGVGGKKFETSAGIEWFTSNVNHFFSRHAVRHDSAWISWKRFVSRSFHLARWISNTSPSPPRTNFSLPFSSPRPGLLPFSARRNSSRGELSVLFFPSTEWLLVRGEEGKRGTDFEGKLWIFTGRARAYRHSRGHPLKFISEYRWNSGTRRVVERENRRADRKISLETMFCGKGFGRWGSLLNLERRDAKGNCRGSTYMGSLLENWSGGDMNF